MAKHKRVPKGKKINPTYFVFCEGESEELYIQYLRSKYRLPVEIVPKITKNKIHERIIRESIKSSPRHEKDQIFLMYDIDVRGLLEKLQIIQKRMKSILLVSNPCFELWYVLHYGNHTAEITSENCFRKLVSLCSAYKKGFLPSKLKVKIEEKKGEAIRRAKKLKLYENPSTSIYQFIELLENGTRPRLFTRIKEI
jgi:hypothetical protein